MAQSVALRPWKRGLNKAGGVCQSWLNAVANKQEVDSAQKEVQVQIVKDVKADKKMKPAWFSFLVRQMEKQIILQRNNLRLRAWGAICGSVGYLVASIWMAYGARHAQISGQTILVREALYSTSGEGSTLARPAEYLTFQTGYSYAVIFLLISVFGFIMSVRAFRKSN